MNHRSIARRGTFLAAFVALAGFGLLQAAEKKDDAKPKYASDGAKTDRPILKPSLTGKLDAIALSRYIDQAIDQRLGAEKVKPSPQADDAEFLRRVYLDLAGHIPPADKAAAFLDNNDPNKRAKLIDELLASDDYGKHMADVWMNLLVKRSSDNRFVQFEPLTAWLAKNFNDNTPWDKLVRELLTAEGSQDENGAVTLFLANNTVDKMTDVTTKEFLGVQLQCAQCHNHPFTDWKQTEYWGMADFFKKVALTGPRNPNKQEGVPGIVEGAVVKGKGRRPPLPDSAKDVPAKFLGGDEVKLTAQGEGPAGAGEVDDLGRQRLFQQGDRQPGLVPAVRPRPRQPRGRHRRDHSAVPPAAVRGPGRPVRGRRLRPEAALPRPVQQSGLSADQQADGRQRRRRRGPVRSHDGQGDDAGRAVRFDDPGAGPQPGPARHGPAQGRPGRPSEGARRQNLTPRSLFVAFFEDEDATDPTEFQQGIPQALRLMNGPQLNNAAVLVPMLRSNRTPEQIIERLYLITLSRRPTAQEQQRLVDYVAQHRNEPHDGYEDVMWVLMNSSEFVMNH